MSASVSKLAGTTAIAGIGQTEFSKESGRSELQLACESVSAALDDAGLSPSDVDGMVTFTMDSSDEIDVARNVGIGDLNFFSRVPHGGGAAAGTVAHAAMAVAAGVADVVVCWRAFNERSGFRFGGSGRTSAETPLFMAHYAPFGLLTPAAWVALHAQRYMSTYGVTNEDFGRIAVVDRAHAATNPDAWFYERRSRWKTTRIRGGSSNRFCDCWIAARRATAGSRWSSPAPSAPATCVSRRPSSPLPRRAQPTTAR